MSDRTEYFRDWHLKNRGRRNARRKDRYQLNRSKEIAQTTAYQKAHPEIQRAAGKKYRNKPEYKEFNRIRSAKWRTENRDRHRELARMSYHGNIEANRERNRIWHKRNPEVKNYHSRKRRALKKGSAVNESGLRDWMARIKKKIFFSCYYCQEKFPIERLHFDHVVPLIALGVHGLQNVCCSCDSCNLSKQDKPLNEWRIIGQLLLKL